MEAASLCSVAHLGESLLRVIHWAVGLANIDKHSFSTLGLRACWHGWRPRGFVKKTFLLREFCDQYQDGSLCWNWIRWTNVRTHFFRFWLYCLWVMYANVFVACMLTSMPRHSTVVVVLLFHFSVHRWLFRYIWALWWLHWSWSWFLKLHIMSCSRYQSRSVSFQSSFSGLLRRFCPSLLPL